MTTAGAGYDVIVLVTITPLQPNLVNFTAKILLQFRLETEEELALPVSCVSVDLS